MAITIERTRNLSCQRMLASRLYYGRVRGNSYRFLLKPLFTSGLLKRGSTQRLANKPIALANLIPAYDVPNDTPNRATPITEKLVATSYKHVTPSAILDASSRFAPQQYNPK